MQLINTSRDSLLKPLQIVSGIVERRHTLPILANLLFKKTGERVSFVSTDIEIQIATTANFGVGDSDTTTTVAARKLLDILRALPEGPVSLNLKDSKLVVQSGKSRFTLQTLSATEFPVMQAVGEVTASWKMPQKAFKQLISQVHLAMAQQDIRYYLNGMLLVIDGKEVVAVATDVKVGRPLASLLPFTSSVPIAALQASVVNAGAALINMSIISRSSSIETYSLKSAVNSASASMLW
jgi:DNA polymerase-3 subunit beta